MSHSLYSQSQLQIALDYWQQQIMLNPPMIEFPCDGLRSCVPDRNLDRHSERLVFPLSSTLRSRLDCWSQTSGIPRTAIILAVFNLLLYRYTDERDLLISAQYHDRPSLLRTQVIPSQSGETLCRSVWETIQATNAHALIPLAEVLETLQPDRDLARNPLTLIQFSIAAEIKQSELVKSTDQKTDYDYDLDYDLDWTMVFDENGLDWHIDLRYRSSLFIPETIRRVVGHYQCLLDGLLQNPITPIAQLPLLTELERQQILTTWNQTENHFFPDFSGDRPIHAYIEDQVLRTPQAIAVRSMGVDGQPQDLTYQALNDRANQLAHYLRSLGIGPGTAISPCVVAVCTDHTLEMVIAFLGILKAGAAYLPLDPTYPQARRVYKLQDCHTPIILTQASLETIVVPKDFPGRILCLDRDWGEVTDYPTTNPTSLSTPDHLAYIIYTSGSTGNPKGVMITHGGLVNHCFAMREAFGLTSCDRMLQFSNMSFDIIIEELYPTLVTGATLVLRTDGITASIDQFMSFIETHQVTILDLPTAFWHELVGGMALLNRRLSESVRLVVVGGEKASKNIYHQWLNLMSPQVRWLNTYGPTEATVSATLYDPVMMGFDFDQPEIPIGRPISNVKTYILDRHHNPVPIHVPGELYIGGPGVARGYLNRVEQTVEKFIPNPFGHHPGDRLYSTGDMVRYLADGTIEFVGRRDFQVKIQGFRVDLGEIERLLESYPEVQQSVVVALDRLSGPKTLVAYIVLSSPITLTNSELRSRLRSHLRSQLPGYMIPVFWVVMSALPLTPNGKIDRKALPAPQDASLLHRTDRCDNDCCDNDRCELVGPQDAIEEKLVALWQKLLGFPHVSVTDNFFDLGGNSLLMMKLLIEIEANWGRSLPVTILFQVPTIRQLARLLQEEQPAKRATVVAFREGGSESPIFCVPGAFGNLRYVHDLVHQLEVQSLPDANRSVYGLQEPFQSDGMPLPTSIEAIAAYYVREVQAIQKEGPYFLVGYSIGGLIAYEMAQQLRQQGQEVALLGLLDPTPPHGYLRSRRLLQQIPTTQRSGFVLQLVLLKCVALLDLYQLRLRSGQKQAVLADVVQDWQHWLRSESGQNFLNPLRQMMGLPPVSDGSNGDTHNAYSTSNLVMKYNRVVLYYLPKPYEGPIKFFFSDEWQADNTNWLSWKHLVLKNLERYYLPGQHLEFHQGRGMATIVRCLLASS